MNEFKKAISREVQQNLAEIGSSNLESFLSRLADMNSIELNAFLKQVEATHPMDSPVHRLVIAQIRALKLTREELRAGGTPVVNRKKG